MFAELQNIAFKHFGIDKIIEQVAEKLGDINAVYITGDLARGLDAQIIDVTLIGKNIDSAYLAELVEKAEGMINKRLRTLVHEPDSEFEIEKPKLLVYGEEEN